MQNKEIEEIEDQLVEDILSEFRSIGIDTSTWEYEFGDGNNASEFIAAGIKAHLEKLTEIYQTRMQGEEWIRVEDRLPEEGKRVLIRAKQLGGKYYTDIAMYTYGGVQEFDDENEDFPDCFDEQKGVSLLPEGFWVTDGDEEKCYQRKASHWQPLPTPPFDPK